MTMLKWAQRYVEQYKWSIIPVKNKVPQLKSWIKYQNSMPTQTDLIDWFQNTDNGIGIVTGKLSSLIVMDVDSKEKLPWMKSGIIVDTPKGYHFYYRYKEGIKNHVRILENVDIRSEGGFVCAPITLGYTWVNPYFNINRIPEFPVSVLPTQTQVLRNEKGWIAEILNNLKEGNRDISFTKVIGRLNRDGYSSSDIALLLNPYAETSGFGTIALNEKINHILSSYPSVGVSFDYSNNNESDNTDSLSEFLKDVKPIQWICEPIIGQGTIVFIAGLPETMKTWICIDLAIEIARGGKWVNRFPVKQGIVLFIDQERYKKEVQRRFKALMKEKDLTSGDLEGKLILRSQTTTRLNLDESFNAFRKHLMEIRPSVVIVDSWATFHTKNENSRQEIQEVFDRINKLRHEFNCTFVFLDHEGKGVLNTENQPEVPNAFAMTGSVGKPAAMETAFAVRRLNETEVIMYHTKSTLGPKIEPIKLKIQDTDKGILIN